MHLNVTLLYLSLVTRVTDEYGWLPTRRSWHHLKAIIIWNVIVAAGAKMKPTATISSHIEMKFLIRLSSELIFGSFWGFSVVDDRGWTSSPISVVLSWSWAVSLPDAEFESGISTRNGKSWFCRVMMGFEPGVMMHVWYFRSQHQAKTSEVKLSRILSKRSNG